MKAAVQILKKTEDLKQKLSGDILNDNEAWINHQQLQDLYQQLLVTDLEYSLDKKVEQDLWNYGFKNQINILQMKAKDRKNPHRNDSQESLVWFLEAASGFYLQLLQELCEAFDLDIPCRRKNSVYGMIKSNSHIPNDFHPPMKASCLYICQHCLVHLGDIARYRNHALQAETFYRHAVELVPSNGQPYNQLAILEAAKGDKLCTVFYYIRSIAVKCPFPVSSTNLQKMFSKMANDEFQYEGKTKLSVYDYIIAFLQFHSLLHLTTGLDKAQKLLKILSSNLTVLIATESLSAWKLIQMTAINIFAAANANRTLDASEKDVESEILTEDEQTAYNLVLELIASTLNGLLLLVYTIKDDSDLKSYYALSVIKLIMDWLKQDLNHLKAPAFSNKLQIWPSFCKLLNSVQSTITPGFDMNKYQQVPLPEDWDLQCFLPLRKAHKVYKFKHISPMLSSDEEHSLRVSRLVDFGRVICGQEIFGMQLMTIKSEVEDKVAFEAVSAMIPGELLKQLEEINLQKSDYRISPVQLMDMDFSNGSSSNSSIVKEDEFNNVNSRMDGFLKTNSSTNAKERKGRPNIALQTIMQKKSPKSDVDDHIMSIMKVKSEPKQVTFKTPSPSPPASSSGTPPLPYLLSSTPSPVFQSDVTPQQFHIRKKAPGNQLVQQDSQFEIHKMNQAMPNLDTLPYNVGYYGAGNGNGGNMNAGGHYGLSSISRPHHPQNRLESNATNQSLMMGNNLGVNPQLGSFNYSNPNISQTMAPISPNRAPANRFDLDGSSLFGQQPWPTAPIEQMLSQMNMSQRLQQQLPGNQGMPNVPSNSNRAFTNPTFAPVQRPQLNQDTFMFAPVNDGMGLYSSNVTSTANSARNKPYGMQMDQRLMMADNYTNNLHEADDFQGKMNPGNSNVQNTYSLFNSSWSSGLNFKDDNSGSANISSAKNLGNIFHPSLQSLWSGPGPSPLERLLEQQKQKEPAPH